MDGVERQIAKPRPGFVLLDEAHRLAPEGVGGVVDLAHAIGAAENRVVRIALGVEISMRAAEEAEVFVKAAPERMEFRPVAQDAICRTNPWRNPRP